MSGNNETHSSESASLSAESGIIKQGAQCWRGPIRMVKSRLVDEDGRTILLRGVNLTGNSKLPHFPASAAVPGTDDFFNHRNLSFIGRPFSIQDAHEHFERLYNWGLTFARILVPWEALEHAGPGIYDQDYIDSLRKILEIAPQYGVKCFIDPHQDTWSRYSGGSGAPGWTFEVVGLDACNFEETGAVHYHRFDDEANVGKMIWPTNYAKLASATMFSVFFGGDVFAPKAMYEGRTCQQFLVEHYINCYKHLAKSLKGVDAVIGIEAMNEPHPGYIGMHELEKFDLNKDLRLANSPLPLQSFALGMGKTIEVDYFVKSWPYPSKKSGTRTLNESKKKAWLPGKSCIWKEHGVWDFDEAGTPVLLKSHYFSIREDGSPVNFRNDFYQPFLKKFATGIHEASPDLIFLFEPIPNEDPPNLLSDPDPQWHSKCIYAPHWYDLYSVFNKKFSGLVTHNVQGLSRGMNVFQASYFGVRGARRNYSFQISNIVKGGLALLGPKPCLIGECGIPMDINEKKAFASGDYSHHNNFLDAVISAMEINLVHFTLWNYNPHNDNEYGDFWNGEDFSIFSRPKNLNDEKSQSDPSLPTIASVTKADEISKTAPSSVVLSATKSMDPNEVVAEDLPLPRLMREGPQSAFDLIDGFFEEMAEKHVGGRALDAVIRPYASKTAGTPLYSLFELQRTAFELVFITPKDQSNSEPLKEGSKRWTTEIYVPQFHYGLSIQPEIVVSDGNWLFDPKLQTITWTINPNEASPAPCSKGSPIWISCPRKLATHALMETHNFHTLQMFKSKAAATGNPTPDQQKGCNMM